MDFSERFELVVRQALEEVGVGEMPTTAELVARVHQDYAAPLGDALYRLCIEHGVEWNTFRESVIDAVLRRPAKVGAAAKRPLAGVESFHDLILLAVETMPPDGLDVPGEE